MISTIASLFGAVLRVIYSIVGENYGLSIIIFTIFTKLILFPVTYKQTKAMKEISKVAPLEKQIREKYKGNKEKITEELTKMYSENKVNPLSGCLPLIIQLPIILAMFYIVKQPLTYVVQTPHAQISEYAQEITGKEDVSENEIKALEIEIARKHDIINMNFLGINFGDIPAQVFKEDSTNKPSKLTIIIPILSLMVAMFQTKQSQKNSTATEEQKQQQKTMTFMMPILSAYISYIMPIALGVYWLLGGILQILTQFILEKMLSKEKVMIDKGGVKNEKNN